MKTAKEMGIKINKEELKKIQELALAFMQSSCVTQDRNSNSLADFIGWLQWLGENSDPGPCYRCHQWPCDCVEGPLMEKLKV